MLGRADLGEGEGLGIELPERIDVELVHPRDTARVHRDVVVRRVEIRSFEIDGDVLRFRALQQCPRQAAIGIGLWRRGGVKILRQIIDDRLLFLLGQIVGPAFMDAFAHPCDLLLPIGLRPPHLRQTVEVVALVALRFDDRLAFAFGQLRWRQLGIELVAGNTPGRPNPSVRDHGSLLVGERHVGRRGLLARQRHLRQLALEAVADALHRVIARRQVVHRVTALGLRDRHESEAALGIDQFDVRAGQRLPGRTLDHALHASGKVLRLRRETCRKRSDQHGATKQSCSEHRVLLLDEAQMGGLVDNDRPALSLIVPHHRAVSEE